MEQSKINKFVIGGLIATAIVGVASLGLVITLLVRNMQAGAPKTVTLNATTEEPVLVSRGFIGRPTSNTIRNEGSIKVVELKGHTIDKEIPGYEPVNASDTDVRAVRIGEQTKITKITNVTGKPPVIEEFSAANLVAVEADAVYLARYEAIGTEVSMDTPAAFLEIYIMPKVKGVKSAR